MIIWVLPSLILHLKVLHVVKKTFKNVNLLWVKALLALKKNKDIVKMPLLLVSTVCHLLLFSPLVSSSSRKTLVSLLTSQVEKYDLPFWTRAVQLLSPWGPYQWKLHVAWATIQTLLPTAVPCECNYHPPGMAPVTLSSPHCPVLLGQKQEVAARGGSSQSNARKQLSVRAQGLHINLSQAASLAALI